MNFISLDKQSKSPLYQQLIDSFQQAINQYTLLPDQRLPSEEVLCQTFNISRSVVKIAYQKLETDGYIYRNPKGGSYVCSQTRYQKILEHAPFLLEALTESGFEWEYKINLNEIQNTTRHLKITYFIEGIPMCVSDLEIPFDIDFDPKKDWSHLMASYQHTTSFKAKILSKYESLFFNQSEEMAVFELMTQFTLENKRIATLKQWISPLMGNLVVEVKHG